MKSTLLLLWFLVICTSVVKSQCIDKDKIRHGGQWYVRELQFSPTYTFAYNGDTSKNWNILNDPIDINQIKVEILPIKDHVVQSIRSFAGDDFYSKLKFNSVEIVYLNKLKEFKDGGRIGLKSKHPKTRYVFYFEFLPDSIATYHISISLNKKGRIVSKFDFPSLAHYKPIDTNFTYCQLIGKAKSIQKDIFPIKDLSLNFDSDRNSFYWLITQDIVEVKDGLNHYNQVLIDAADLTKASYKKVDSWITVDSEIVYDETK